MDYHAETGDAVLSALGSATEGLGSAEADTRLQSHGPNALPTHRGPGPMRRLLAQLSNLLIVILLVAALVTALMGHWLDTAVILAVVAVNTVIGFVQEGRAEKALDAIKGMLSPRAIVRRDGQKVEIDAREIVPGDIVLLASGDRVPADLRLLRVRNLRVEEAALTGESVPVDKSPEPVAPEVGLAERSSMAFSGTLVAAGQAEGVVVATGKRTEIGRISAMLTDVEGMTTPLLKQMQRFARTLSIVILGVAGLMFAFGYIFRGYAIEEIFLAVVALFVAAIPEGLPAILTVTLAIGVQAMARRNAVIRKLPAVETLGSVSVICSDKTGTFTRNEMTVSMLETPATGLVRVSGSGYVPEGRFETEAGAAETDELATLLEVAGLCNDSTIREEEDQWIAVGDPMEAALITLARKAGPIPDVDRYDVIPFESDHAFMATLHPGRILLKGAPEIVLDLCSDQKGVDGSEPLDRRRWRDRVDAMAGEGARVLAAAVLHVPDDRRELGFEDVKEGLTFVGLYGLIDPPREEAIAAVKECREAGIRVKMITGDHAATARAIARQLGIEHAEEVLTGSDIEAMDDEDLAARAFDCDVFARTSPEHKLRLVKALQARGLSVAMTGDGVNDAPALKRADIGIAMGRKGTEAAREAAQMVLTDDNFASISAAVREGRVVYDNIRKAILFLLPINGGESGALMAALLLGVTLPITALQVLWVNMVSSLALALPLAFERAEPGVMRRPPRPPGQPLLTRFLLWRILLVSMIFLAGIFGMFLVARARGLGLEEARTVAVNTLVMMEVWYMFSVRYLHGSSLSLRAVLGTPAVLVSVATVALLQLGFTFVPFMNTLFGTAPIGVDWAAAIFLVGIAGFAAVELDKWVARRRRARRLQGQESRAAQANVH